MNSTLIFETILESLELPFTYLINPMKRIHWFYLVTSAALALLVYYRKPRKVTVFEYLFPKNIWGSKSAGIDYIFLFINGLLKVGFLIPTLYLIGPSLAFDITEWLQVNLGGMLFSFSPQETIVYYTIALILVGDFAAFLLHYLMHKLPFLWEFHKIHHSATVLNPITQYRLHPIELILINLRVALVYGIVTGLFDYFSEHLIRQEVFMGVNVFTLAFLVFGSNLRHSHVKLKYFSFLEYILISPFQHQIHHSNKTEHFDKNMGSTFAVWDWMFGTLKRSKNIKTLQFGLGGDDDKNYTSFFNNLLLPFKNLFLKKK